MSSTTAEGLSSAAGPPLVSESYRRYAVGVLMVLYTINFLDRQIVTILAEPIKTDLGLSDTQLGLLTGLAFGIVYCGFGLVMARLADRFNRVSIIGASLIVWSACTLVCGRVASFPALLAARMGVGVGEAAFTPTSHSLIADYTPKEKRASALAIFSMGSPIGSLLGLAMGGVIADALGWRMAFFVAGLPGLILAVVVFATLKEPRALARRAGAATAASAGPQSSFLGTLRFLASRRTFWFTAFGASIYSFVGYGHGAFLASFFLRVHAADVERLAGRFGLEPVGFLGVSLGLVVGICGAISAWLGGVIADRFGARDLRAYGSVPAFAGLLAIPFALAAWLVPSVTIALAMLVPTCLLTNLWFGPVYATAQGLVPPHMRATSASIVLFIINMMGLGFGALVVGALSDAFNHGLGLGVAEGIRWALLASTLFLGLATVLFLLARGRIRDEIIS